ncbi:MAG: TonB-dependent receptor plug domain-containing protein, partial [Tannerellaceae bacterium]
MLNRSRRVGLILLTLTLGFSENAFAGSGNEWLIANATQQQQTVKGTVSDASGPIIGASVLVKGSTIGTSTNIDGEFSINASKGATLIISYIGYVSQEVTVTGKSLAITLKEDFQQLEEVVVVGFGTQKKVNLTGSVSTVTSKALASRPVTNVSQALQGLVPGLNFSYDSRGNGGEMNQNMKMNIRGGGTIGSGSNSSPLVLIDGMEGDMNALNPQDVENISVLKDAAASSIYGSRAPFGVILITTKKGNAGKVNINYNNNFRWTNAINMPKTADSYTYAKYFNRASSNAGETVMFDAQRLELIKDYQDGKITTTTVPDPGT